MMTSPSEDCTRYVLLCVLIMAADNSKNSVSCYTFISMHANESDYNTNRASMREMGIIPLYSFFFKRYMSMHPVEARKRGGGITPPPPMA